MKRSLLLISLVCLCSAALCQDKTKVTSKKTIPAHVKRHKVKKTKPVEIIHNAPDQKKIDSIKNEKLRQQKKNQGKN